MEEGDVSKDLIGNRPCFYKLEAGKAVSRQKARESKGIRDDEKPHHELSIAGLHRFVSTAPDSIFIGRCHRCIHMIKYRFVIILAKIHFFERYKSRSKTFWVS